MASNYTQHVQLPLWEPDDSFLREEFNEANRKIDTALSGLDSRIDGAFQAVARSMLRLERGSYVGTGTYGPNTPNSLTFSFPPELVVITANIQNGLSLGTVLIQGQQYSGGIGITRSSSNGLRLITAWAENTVTWYTNSSSPDDQMNGDEVTYYYFAIG